MMVFKIQSHCDCGDDFDAVRLFRDEHEAYRTFKRSCEATAEECGEVLEDNPVPENPWDDVERETDDFFVDWRCEDAQGVVHAIEFRSYWMED